MSNEKRINRILTKLGMIWKRYPDLRFGQLIETLTDPENTFYIEDSQLEMKIDSIIETLYNE